jgi:hypothetical protein
MCAVLKWRATVTAALMRSLPVGKGRKQKNVMLHRSDLHAFNAPSISEPFWMDGGRAIVSCNLTNSYDAVLLVGLDD